MNENLAWYPNQTYARNINVNKWTLYMWIHKYLDIKSGNIPARPITIIFGGKAAPCVCHAQDVIHLIFIIWINRHDPEVSPYLQVVMIENYNVTAATHFLIPCNTWTILLLLKKLVNRNMKFMLNGALTLGTEDGANVEIHELVETTTFSFGEKRRSDCSLWKRRLQR